MAPGAAFGHGCPSLVIYRHLVRASTHREDTPKVKGRYGTPLIALHSAHAHKPSISGEHSPQAARFDAKL